MWTVVIAFAAVVVVGSIAEIHAQSGGYRSSVNSGYAELASQVVTSSNRTGRTLATLVDQAPTLSNGAFSPYPSSALRSARAQLQQGLDQAVNDADQEATQAAHLVPPFPTGDISAGFTGVMAARAGAVTRLRTVIDRQLGMSPLAVAGAPVGATPVSSAALLSIGEASSAMGAVGRLLQSADRAYRVLGSSARTQHAPIRLPRSVWVTAPQSSAPLGASQLAALAPALAASGALKPFHQLVITAAGLSPAAVTSGASGTIGTGCGVQAQSTVAGTTPSVLPPTGTLGADLTVTNCGTVEESGETVTETLSLADPAGTALPPQDRRGGTRHVALATIQPGSSVGVTLSPLPVAGGHRYSLGLSVTVPPGQLLNPDGAAGTSQQFLVQITP